VVGAEEVDPGSWIRPIPGGFGETMYAIEPRTMTEKTVMTRSSRAMAVASGSYTP